MSKVRESHALEHEHDKHYVEVWLQATETEMRQIADVVFPPGSLQDDASFTTRELEILKLLMFQSEKMKERLLNAEAMAALRRQGVTFSA